jgi:outer membrane protein OmpA-like peptidoglycan-associated protein
MRILKGTKVSLTGLRLAAVAGLAALLGACGGVALEGVQGLDPQGSEFNMQLYAGYIELSSNELRESDYRDSDHFAMKAAVAARGDDVRPTALEERLIAPDKVEELAKARNRLMAMLYGGGKNKAPIVAARAQLSFDCWMQEQEEGHQPGDIADCRNAFYGSVVAVEVAMRPAPPPAPEPAPAPEPEPEPSYVTYYVVFFEFDSSELSNAAKQTLNEAAATALEMRPYKVLIRGHTDRAGPDAYNLKLSETRALSVASYLIENGAGRFVIHAEGLGESEPIAKTSDNVRDGRNRRSEISLIEAE